MDVSEVHRPDGLPCGILVVVTCHADESTSRPVPMLVLSDRPIWASALLIVVLPTLIAMAGPPFVRRHYTLDRLRDNNEVAGFKFATVGVVYAVLLGFP